MLVKRLKSLQKAEAYLEPKPASTMELFVNILNHLLFSQYKFHHRYWTGLYIGLWHFQNEAKLEQIIAVVYNAQRFLLWIVIPSSKTLPLASTFVEFIFNMCLWWDLSPKIMNWNFPGLAFNEFNLNLFNILFVSKIWFSLISVNLSPHEYKV